VGLRVNLIITLVLAACIPLAAVVALLVEATWWAAAYGAALVLVYWGLDRLFTRLGQTGSVQRAVLLSVGGVAVRLVFVGAALAALGLLARPEFSTAAIAFLAVFTGLLSLRIGTGMKVRMVL
jgi:hypothetical protein